MGNSLLEPEPLKRQVVPIEIFCPKASECCHSGAASTFYIQHICLFSTGIYFDSPHLGSTCFQLFYITLWTQCAWGLKPSGIICMQSDACNQHNNLAMVYSQLSLWILSVSGTTVLVLCSQFLHSLIQKWQESPSWFIERHATPWCHVFWLTHINWSRGRGHTTIGPDTRNNHLMENNKN